MPERIFHSWIPRQLDFWILVLLSILLSFSNGLPTTLSSYIISGQAGITADISMASYAYYTGMVCAMPLVFRFTRFASKKTLLAGAYLFVILFNFILAESSDTLSVTMASFVIGATKIFGTMALLGELIPTLMPKGERYQLYAFYYPLAMVIPAISGMVATHIADSYFWEMSFHFQNLLLCCGLLIILLLTRVTYEKRVPLYQYDWLGTLLLAICLLFTAYFTTYGLTENWFHSKRIAVAAIGTGLSLVLLLHHNFRVRKPLLLFQVFRYRAVGITLGSLFLLGAFYSSTSQITSFISIMAPGNPVKNAGVNTYVVAGYLAGSLLSYLYFKRTKNCRIIFSFSCLCYLICTAWIFILIHPQTDPSLLFFPLFFRGMGLIISFITAGVYLAANVPVKLFLPSVTFLIIMRSFIVPVFWSNLLANWYYHRQLIHLNSLAGNIDRIDPMVISRGSGLATTIQQQAALLSLRDIFGMLSLAGFLLFIIMANFPYHSSRIRHIFDWRNPARAKELIQATPV